MLYAFLGSGLFACIFFVGEGTFGYCKGVIFILCQFFVLFNLALNNINQKFDVKKWSWYTAAVCSMPQAKCIRALIVYDERVVKKWQ